MRHRCLGQARPGRADRAPAPARTPRIDEDDSARGRETARQGQARADRRRRRRAGCLARGDAALRHAAGARARLPARTRRARRPRSVQRHAAARPRIVGRSRCGARGRHPAAQSAERLGHRQESEDRARRCRPRRAGAPAQAEGGADRRRRADPAAADRRARETQSAPRFAPRRNAGAPGQVARSASPSSRRSSPSST